MIKTKSGFTIVELLIVIVVIGILAAITIVAYNGIQNRAIMARSLSELASINNVLQLYNAEEGSYPTTNGVWFYSGSRPTDYVPGLVPAYINALPKNTVEGDYLYLSNGVNYKIMAHNGKYRELCPQVKAAHPEMVPNRDCWAYGYYSPGGKLF